MAGMTLREHLNPFHSRRVAISCPHPAAECAERLRAEIGPRWAFWRPGLKGSVSEERFALFHSYGTHEGFPSEARGRFEPAGRGTRLETRIGWRRFNVLAYTIGVLALTWWFHRMGAMSMWGAAAYLLLALAIGAYGRVVCRKDDEWLVEELRDLLDGDEVPGAG